MGKERSRANPSRLWMGFGKWPQYDCSALNAASQENSETGIFTVRGPHVSSPENISYLGEVLHTGGKPVLRKANV